MESGEKDLTSSTINHIKNLTLLSKYNELNGQVTLPEWTKTAPLKKSLILNQLAHEERAGQISDRLMTSFESKHCEQNFSRNWKNSSRDDMSSKH
ncbi:hypothetical protein TNCV_536221 [Trichonephila clavipes]|nr:hypothetical protein TNCV_536221 [Trichonephila clavipes]